MPKGNYKNYLAGRLFNLRLQILFGAHIKLIPSREFIFYTFDK